MWSWKVVNVRAEHRTPPVPSVSWRRRQGGSGNANPQGGKLGHTTLESNSIPIPIPIPKPKEEGEISGSDVLWALQRASGRKKKRKEHRRESSSVPTPRDVDYSNVHVCPLRINSNWSAKFLDFDKRLRELSDTI
ncbi:hypothetical protein VNO78_18637 [Psophocarpus tetragonolobus]|uniref:Uncharacterized protein n=1 Tax=Psophocarpus tetragonolobus TaxID=3891 RepID=A0AAN9SL92_PSOTE